MTPPSQDGVPLEGCLALSGVGSAMWTTGAFCSHVAVFTTVLSHGLD